MVKAVRDYFLKCPLLQDGLFHVNYLGVDPVEYTIDQVPADPIVKRYADGGSIRQLTFVFASREAYGSDVLVNIESSGFYNQLIDWIEKQNKLDNLPELPDGKTAQSFEIQTQAYMFEADEDQARYQIQARLLYFQD